MLPAAFTRVKGREGESSVIGENPKKSTWESVMENKFSYFSLRKKYAALALAF